MPMKCIDCNRVLTSDDDELCDSCYFARERAGDEIEDTPSIEDRMSDEQIALRNEARI